MREYSRIILAGVAALCGCFAEPPDVDVSGTTGDGETTLPTLSPSTTWSPPPNSGTASASSTSSDPSGGTESGSGDDDSEASSSGAWGSTSSGSESSSGSGESSTTGEPLGPYGDCHDGAIGETPPLCPGSCMISEPTHSACAPDCAGGCGDGPDGFATTCLDGTADGTVAAVCFVPCDEGGPCPAGMDCSPLEYTQGGSTLWACLWP